MLLAVDLCPTDYRYTKIVDMEYCSFRHQSKKQFRLTSSVSRSLRAFYDMMVRYSKFWKLHITRKLCQLYIKNQVDHLHLVVKLKI